MWFVFQSQSRPRTMLYPLFSVKEPYIVLLRVPIVIANVRVLCLTSNRRLSTTLIWLTREGPSGSLPGLVSLAKQFFTRNLPDSVSRRANLVRAAGGKGSS